MEPFDTIDRVCLKESPSAEDIQELIALTRMHPHEPELWDVLGDVMQLCEEERPIQESIDCYRRAIEYDDTYAPAYESLGWVLDAFQDDFENAAKYFRLALQHGAGDTARIGLARVLAQTGKTNEAINCLNECRDQTSAEVVKMRQEICEGLWHSESQDKA